MESFKSSAENELHAKVDDAKPNCPNNSKCSEDKGNVFAIQGFTIFHDSPLKT